MSTTYLSRFADAMETLCNGNRPTSEMIITWFADPDSFELQEFAMEHGPSWAQGIAVIDAATILADQPCEGEGHEPAPDSLKTFYPKLNSSYIAVPREMIDLIRNCFKRDYEEDGRTIRGEVLHQLNTTMLPVPNYEKVQFPTYLRKMWSGGEVQEWLDSRLNELAIAQSETEDSPVGYQRV